MGIIHLSIELTLDLIALIIGIILIIRAKDNYPKLYWGISRCQHHQQINHILR